MALLGTQPEAEGVSVYLVWLVEKFVCAFSPE
jgi:hypothetical protein